MHSKESTAFGSLTAEVAIPNNIGNMALAWSAIILLE
jgi:hypothetical protein